MSKNSVFQIKETEKSEISHPVEETRLKGAALSKETLWVVTELYYPEETSTGYYLTRIAEGLADEFNVKVLCGQPNYSGRGIRAPKKEFHKDVEIFRTFGTTLDKNIILFRLINMLTLSFSVFWRALLNFQKRDKILVVTTPPSLPFIIAFACYIKKCIYVLLIHDNYPEILIAVGKAKENSLLVRLLDLFNRRLYKGASKIIVVGRDMRKLIERKTKDFSTAIEYIPNWAELEQVKPSPRGENNLLKELQLEEKFVFLYAGNMGYPNDLESIVWCAGKLKDDARFHFIFLGAGVKKKWLENEIKIKELDNVTLLAPRPRSEQNDFLNACDVALVSLVKKMQGVSMPSRTYNILAVGKPILALAEPDSEVAILVEEYKIGWVTPPDEPEQLLKVIYEIYSQAANLELMAKRSRQAALQNYSVAEAIRKYQKALK